MGLTITLSNHSIRRLINSLVGIVRDKININWIVNWQIVIEPDLLYIGMNIIAYLDNDSLNTLNTKDAAVFTLELRQNISKEQLLKQHPRVLKKTWEC